MAKEIIVRRMRRNYDHCFLLFVLFVLWARKTVENKGKFRGGIFFLGPSQVKHVQSVMLGRRNYHYLMAGLVLDEQWDSQVIIIIIITRPKPAYGQQGLAGSWGQDTDKVSNFWVSLTSYFAQLGIKPTWDHSWRYKSTWHHENQTWSHNKNMKNQPGTMKNQPGTMKNH